VNISPNSITPTLQQSPGQVPDKVANTNHKSPAFMICVRDFVVNLSRTLSQTSRHVKMDCVCDFRDLCPRLSRGSFGESGVKEFGLYTAWLGSLMARIR